MSDAAPADPVRVVVLADVQTDHFGAWEKSVLCEVNGMVEGVDVPDSLRQAAEEAGEKAQTAIYLIDGDSAVAVFAVADAIREESYEAVRALHERGIEVAMLTGDSRAVAESVAEELGIDTVFAELLPDDKAEKVKELQS